MFNQLSSSMKAVIFYSIVFSLSLLLALLEQGLGAGLLAIVMFTSLVVVLFMQLVVYPLWHQPGTGHARGARNGFSPWRGIAKVSDFCYTARINHPIHLSGSDRNRIQDYTIDE